MEQIDDFARLARLESSVEKLLGGYNALQQEKAELEERLQSREAEIVTLRQTIEELQAEKKTVHQRVSGLLDSIDQWEESQARQEHAVVEEDPEPSLEVRGTDDGGGAESRSPQLSMMAIDV